MRAKQVKRIHWSPKKWATTITVRKEGYSYREVAAKLGHWVTPSGTPKLFKRFQDTCSVENKTARGRSRLTTSNTDRHITRLTLNNRRASSGDINKDLREMGVKVSDRTVRRRLVNASQDCKDWSPKKGATAITVRKEGYSYREVTAKLGHGVTPSGIPKLFKRFQDTCSVENNTARGRNRLTTPNTDRQITRLVLNNRRASSGDINKELREMVVKVCDRTVRRCLVNAGLRARIARKEPFLNVMQRQKNCHGKKNMSPGQQNIGRKSV